MEVSKPPALKRSPGDHSPEGRARMSRGTARLFKNRLDPLVCECRKQGKKTRKENTKRPADKRPKKGLRAVQEIPKTHGAEKRTPEKTQKQKDARPKRADKQKEKDSGTGETQKKRKGTRQQSVQGGV